MGNAQVTARPFLPALPAIAALAVLASAAGGARAAALRAGGEGAYPTLGAALAAADTGDEIILAPGTYPERGLEIRVPLTLRGEGFPVLDARGGGTILDIRADGVRVSGLVFRGVGFSSLHENGAVWVTGASGALIEGNRFERCYFGVYGAEARRLTVRGNRVEGLYGKEATNGNGIHLWKCDSITVVDNEVRGHRDGMYFEFTGHSLAMGNLCEGNVRYGLHFMYAHGNRYDGNVFRSNGSGVAVMYSRDVHMRGNRFEANWGAASYGVLLKSIKESRIEDNIFDRNTVAVLQEASSGLSVTGNTFRANGWAMRIVADCDRNTFEGNRFEGNSFDVAYNASVGNSNVFRRNAWDRYQGWDMDRDGIGDVAHRPVELFPTLMQEHPQAMALLRSHFVSLLNVLERMFPTLSPESLEDAEPLMPAKAAKAPHAPKAAAAASPLRKEGA
jgi:nitrous oxidase accessory protein